MKEICIEISKERIKRLEDITKESNFRYMEDLVEHLVNTYVDKYHSKGEQVPPSKYSKEGYIIIKMCLECDRTTDEHEQRINEPCLNCGSCKIVEGVGKWNKDTQVWERRLD
jgi:ferredoxin-like protein FixX